MALDSLAFVIPTTGFRLTDSTLSSKCSIRLPNAIGYREVVFDY